MDADRIPKIIFNNQSMGNRPRNRLGNCEQADLNKCKIFDWKNKSIYTGGWERCLEYAKVAIAM